MPSPAVPIPPPDIVLYRSGNELGDIEQDWQRLYLATPAASPVLAPAHGRLAAAHLPATARLAVIVARRSGRVQGLWPLRIDREQGITIARHLGGGSHQDYGAPLFAGPDVLPAMLAAARREADALQLCNLPADHPLLPLLAAAQVRHTEAIASPVIRCAGAGDFERWLAGRSKNFRQSVRSARRRLEAMGELRAGPVAPHEAAAFTDWLFAAKCAWADGRGVGESWLRQAEPRAFVAAALAAPDSGMVGHGLWLDGRPIAGSLSLVGGVFEYFVTTYDPAFAKGSPGHVLTGLLVAEAIARRLDFDFRITRDAYKARWVDDLDHRVTVTIANHPRAWPLLARRQAHSLRRSAGRLYRRLRG